LSPQKGNGIVSRTMQTILLLPTMPRFVALTAYID
jgi:hypothetical protein